MYSSSQFKIRNPSWDAMKKISTWDVVDKVMFMAFSQTIVIVLCITSKRQQNYVCFTTIFSWIDSEKSRFLAQNAPICGRKNLFIRTYVHFPSKKPLFAIWKGGGRPRRMELKDAPIRRQCYFLPLWWRHNAHPIGLVKEWWIGNHLQVWKLLETFSQNPNSTTTVINQRHHAGH